MQSLQGQLLVAAPRLNDALFSRSVVLVIRHGEEGALGVILNHPTKESVSRLWEHIGGEFHGSDRQVYIGGPVSGPIVAMHGQEPLSDMELPDGMYLAASKEHLEQVVQQTDEPYRVFVGMSRWQPGQLENELAGGAWHTAPSRPELVLEEHQDLWREMMREIGNAFYRNDLGIRHFPADVSAN